jgi:lipid-binding SYLF domain-containing protein
MSAKDPTLRDMIDRSAGYAVYPNVGAAGAIVGGAYGRGVVFENGRPVGFTELNQGAVGAILGGQTYSQMIVFENEAALGRLKAGNFDVGAEASAVALKAGVAAATRFEGGIAIFQEPKGGLMATAAVTGQKINFQPMQQSYGGGGSGSAGAGTGRGRAPDEASAYSVDQNLQPSETIRLETEPSAQGAADNAQTATDRTEQRIEQRLHQGRDGATHSSGGQQQ